MWYTMKYDEKDALMFFDNTTRSIHFADDIESALHQEYLAWVAEGNETKEWTDN